MSTLTQAQLQWILLNHSEDKKEQFDQLKLLSYIIDPQRAKTVFEVKNEEQETVVASQDWFIEQIKQNSKLDEEQIKEALKQGVEEVQGDNFTVIEKV
jgi:hypothetical protein